VAPLRTSTTGESRHSPSRSLRAREQAIGKISVSCHELVEAPFF